MIREPGFLRRTNSFAADHAQNNNEVDMTQPDKAEIIRGLFAAYLRNDRNAVADAFSADFRFTSPYDDRLDKATYFERCWRASGWIERQEIERILVQGDAAFVSYNCMAKGGRNFRNAELFLFAGDKIRRIDVFFGPTYDHGTFVPAAPTE